MAQRTAFYLLILLSANLFYISVIGWADEPMVQPEQVILETVNFHKADLVTVLQQLAFEAGYNLIATPEVTGTVNVKLTKVTFEQVLDFICRSRGLVYQKEGRNYFVGTRGQAFNDQKNIGYFHIYYADPNQLVELIKKVVGPNLDISYDERTRTIITNSSREIVAQVSNIIESLDRKMPQITIEVKVIEVSNSALDRLAKRWKIDENSMNWGAPPSGAELILSMVGAGHSWNIIFNDLVSNGNARLVTSPSISTIDGKEASILIGDKIPVMKSTIASSQGATTQVTIEYVDVGVKLIFTPKIQKGDELIIDLKSQVNTLGEKSGDYYIIGAREVNSSIQAKIGQTVFLGGLITQKDRDNLAKVPGISQIPLLGKLFFQKSEKTNEQTEIIITITPRWNENMTINN